MMDKVSELMNKSVKPVSIKWCENSKIRNKSHSSVLLFSLHNNYTQIFLIYLYVNYIHIYLQDENNTW